MAFRRNTFHKFLCYPGAVTVPVFGSSSRCRDLSFKRKFSDGFGHFNFLNKNIHLWCKRYLYFHLRRTMPDMFIVFIRKRWPCAIWKAEVATGCEELPSVVLSVDRAAPIPLESELCIRCCTTFCCFCMLLLLQRIYLGLKSIWVCLQFQPSWYASPFCVVGAVCFKYTNRTRSIVCVCLCVCVRKIGIEDYWSLTWSLLTLILPVVRQKAVVEVSKIGNL